MTNASGKLIYCHGHGEVDAILGLRGIRRSFSWSFVIADVIHPILGTDFLAAHSLLVDCKNNVLTDSLTKCRISLQSSSTCPSSFSVNLTTVDSRVQPILSKYPVLTSPLQLSSVNDSTPPLIEHHIDKSNKPPIHFKTRPLTGTKLKAAKEEFQFFLDAGIIQRSNSQWALPLHLVPKKESGKWRPVGDNRSLNSITQDDKYPIPHLHSLTMSLHDKSIFSKPYLQRVYLQIPVAIADIPKTAVTTPFGLFEFKYMTFGLKNAESIFQRCIYTIMANLKSAYIYLDDMQSLISLIPQNNKYAVGRLSLVGWSLVRMAGTRFSTRRRNFALVGNVVLDWMCVLRQLPVEAQQQ